jgi:hypothetical protein
MGLLLTLQYITALTAEFLQLTQNKYHAHYDQRNNGGYEVAFVPLTPAFFVTGFGARAIVHTAMMPELRPKLYEFRYQSARPSPQTARLSVRP